MKKLTLEEIKNHELEVMIKIDNICRANNIKYTLSGGTLLGAVRHKGFIPWDDDIDISMRREDYNRFMDYCSKNDVGFKIVSNETNEYYPYLFAKAYSEDTLLDQFWINDEHFKMGVFVDIFPVEALGETFDDAKKMYRDTKFNKYLLIASVWKKEVLKRTEKFSRKMIKYIFYFISKHINRRKHMMKLNKIINRVDASKSNYCSLIAGVYGTKEVFENEMYENYIELEFENHKFMAVRDYDKYLTQIYGDYMTLPPEDKRISNHSFDAYLK